ncbi:aminotransferase class III-fold pyridoxal phosphate-dependent enzyme [Qaidamihabitans albus]|uniref:aminotransferase class III-fold pyridoxal phosphate-dependent enzyme n=1 Tax=Qaidamihabitans albus TaxID=2795733 RepID=UPI001F441CE2|nr:aminotransferase class III-fold pyridoxal phosphate-dependent enzyme [Qaidamihabitans albus]
MPGVSETCEQIVHCHHGRSFAAVGITGNRGWSASALSPVRVSYVHGGYRYRSPFRELPDNEYIDACVQDLVDVVGTSTSGDVACMIAEPIQGIGGFTSGPDGLLGAMKEVLDEYGILFISDEVQSGWGRTGFLGYRGTWRGSGRDNLAKGLGNGLAVGGVVARGDIMDCFTANSFSTFGGNPVAMAGANAVLDYLLDHDLQANAAARGSELMAGLRAATPELPVIGDVRGKGLMIGIELVEPGGRTPSQKAAALALEETRVVAC